MEWRQSLKPMRQTFDEAVYSMLHLLPSGAQKEIYSNFVHESGRAAREIGYWIFDSKKASKVDETKVECPALVIAGAKDRITPASVVRQVARKSENVATFKEFENHAHWVVGEPGWQEIAEYISVWIRKVLSESI